MSPGPAGLVVGPDGAARCPWGASPQDYADYHDQEWGRPVHGDVRIFERISLEAFQSGLSWLTVLLRRDGFARAFHGWAPEAIASYSEADVERLLADAGIIRNRAKINAVIGNARALLRLWDERGEDALDRLVWSHAPQPGPPPRLMSEVPTATGESRALARELKVLGFTFVGPTTAYAAMQAMGVVNDHLDGCAFR